MPDSRAETAVKAGQEWQDYLAAMVKAREEANLLKVRMEFLRMKWEEEKAANYLAGNEARLVR